jgi:hypothetical protein
LLPALRASGASHAGIALVNSEFVHSVARLSDTTITPTSVVTRALLEMKF